jgi:predicted Fe-Mo cluster-binding NifX family protein
MKIAITSNGEGLCNQIDLRFGTAKGFIIYDLDTNDFEYIGNVQNLEASQVQEFRLLKCN